MKTIFPPHIFPVGDRIAVLPVSEEEKIAGLEIIRDYRNIEMQHGKVIAAGIDSPITTGDYVIYNPSAGTMFRRLRDDGVWEELRIMHSDTIQAILR